MWCLRHRSFSVAPRACVRVYARVLVPPNLYLHTYTHTPESRTRLAVRGVPKGALRTDSVVQVLLWGGLVTCRVLRVRQRDGCIYMFP